VPLTVRDFMETDVPTVHPQDSTETVLRRMRDHELSGIVVVNDGGRPVGIITERDLVISDEGEEVRLPAVFELWGGVIFLEPLQRFEARVRKAFGAKARDLMTEDPVTIGSGASAHDAARLIAQTKHNRLPVVEDDRLVGVVTRVDVLDALTADEDDAA
jgi:CBS domain-containing protein